MRKVTGFLTFDDPEVFILFSMKADNQTHGEGMRLTFDEAVALRRVLGDQIDRAVAVQQALERLKTS